MQNPTTLESPRTYLACNSTRNRPYRCRRCRFRFDSASKGPYTARSVYKLHSSALFDVETLCVLLIVRLTDRSTNAVNFAESMLTDAALAVTDRVGPGATAFVVAVAVYRDYFIRHCYKD